MELKQRGKFLGEITKLFKDVIGVAGTHGKTTTSSMVSSAFMSANLDPSIQIGANLRCIDGNYRVGNSDYFIIEACEYCESYLNFKQRSAIVTNIDNDHLDYFKNIDNIEKSFQKYVSMLPSDGLLVVNMDDERCYNLRNHTRASVLTTSMTNEKADYYAKNISYNDEGCASYDLMHNNEKIDRITLGVAGSHNVSNSLECIALCLWYKLPIDMIKEGLIGFTGASRRLEYKGKFNGADVYDDYGHHPTEIKATADSILKKKFNILRPTMILNNGWKVEGKIFGSGLSIKSNDKIIAKITSSKIDDSTYQIELDKNENELLILMIIVVTYIDNAISERILEKNI